MISPQAVSLSPDVRQALASGRAVVALESTIIAHGMPYPTNVEVALAVENIVREAARSSKDQACSSRLKYLSYQPHSNWEELYGKHQLYAKARHGHRGAP